MGDKSKEQTHLSASILGFYGAIKLAIQAGHRPEDVFKIVKEFVDLQMTELKIDVSADLIDQLRMRSKASGMALEQVASLMIRAGLMATDKRKEHGGD